MENSSIEDGGVYIEYTDPEGDAIRRVPITLPIPSDECGECTIEPRDVETAVLAITHEYLSRCGMKLNQVHVHPFRRVKFIGDGGESEPGLEGSTSSYGAGYQKLQSIEFYGVENVRHIPHHFLVHCYSLQTVDLSPFRSVTSVGSDFLLGCESLTSIDLAPFANVDTVGHGFLRTCSGLTSINLQPLRNVTNIRVFLYSCRSLRCVDLSPLQNIMNIVGVNNEVPTANELEGTRAEGDQEDTGSFLQACISLTTINLTPLSNITALCTHFLAHCTSLTSIDLSPLAKVTYIPSCFMEGCASIATLDLRPFANVTKIGDAFMRSCTSLKSIDLGPLSRVRSVGFFFMQYCISLTTVDLTPLVNVTTVKPYFMYNCKSLTNVDPSPLINGGAAVLEYGLDVTFLGKSKAITQAQRKKFMKAVEDKQNGIVAPPTPAAARKVAVKVGGKKEREVKTAGERK